ncbi:MAG: hypothetical protein A2234_01360 [Elusimicrobia bacterium RIFOXYA2_FULL_58_8]|nr:MAG: hypothetical protein A2285_06405 [Elusimicrobia bacterium RIFOXYA12_FULL_57_11]OGS15361.1 MAG: hypothetical protein A2234_01360 [Elusimicrobia bacterium RIFOXYA2_FULL_58_8]
MQAWSKVPAVLAALILLLAGSFIGRWLRVGVEKALGFTKLDEYAAKVGFSDILRKLGVGQSPVTILGFLIYWLVFLAFLLSAANVVELTVVSEFLQQIVMFMPKLIASILIMGGGLFLGHFLAEITGNAAKANEVSGAEGLAKATHTIVVVFSAIMALERLGIDTAILSQSVQIVLASAGFGLAIAFGMAFGLAGKELAGQWLQRFIKK